MGGVDLMDRMIAHYPHGFKSKKWYFRVFFPFTKYEYSKFLDTV